MGLYLCSNLLFSEVVNTSFRNISCRVYSMVYTGEWGDLDINAYFGNSYCRPEFSIGSNCVADYHCRVFQAAINPGIKAFGQGLMFT